MRKTSKKKEPQDLRGYIAKQVFAFPGRKDYIIPGELVRIEILHNSFVVFYQIDGFDRYLHELVLQQKIFPICFLSDFFKENGARETKYLVHRPKSLLDKSNPKCPY